MPLKLGENMAETRNYSLDLLRILATFMVVVLHVQLFGGLLQPQPFSRSFLPTIILESLCIVAVNCFVLITGFFMIHKTLNWKKLLNLFVYIVTISWLIFIIGTACGLRESLKHLVFHLFPVSSGYHWFVSSYIAVYILSPWANKFILSLSRKESFFLGGLLFVIFSLWAVNPKVSAVTAFNGYSVGWLLYIYFIGAVIRLHIKKIPFGGWCYLATTLGTIIVAVGMCKFGKGIAAGMYYNSPFVLLASIGLFSFFYHLRITSAALTKIIGFFVPGCFGVFLVHTDVFVCPYYVYLFKQTAYPDWFMTLTGSLAVFGVSIVASVYIYKAVNWVCGKMLFPALEKIFSLPYVKMLKQRITYDSNCQ